MVVSVFPRLAETVTIADDILENDLQKGLEES